MRNDVTSMRIFNAGVRIMLSLGCIVLHEYPGPAPPPPTAHQTKLSLVPTFIPLSPLLFQHTIGGCAESLDKFLSKCVPNSLIGPNDGGVRKRKRDDDGDCEDDDDQNGMDGMDLPDELFVPSVC